MKKFVCKVCGYVYEGENPPEVCPQCKAKDAFIEQTGDLNWACEHVIGVGKEVDPRVVEGLKANFEGECTEVGMYLAMSRQAIREGYPEIGEFYRTAALEEAEHAAKFAELLGEVVYPDTKTRPVTAAASRDFSKDILVNPFCNANDRYQKVPVVYCIQKNNSVFHVFSFISGYFFESLFQIFQQVINMFCSN